MIDVDSELYNSRDEAYADFVKGLIPGKENVIGVRSPVLRKIAKMISKDDWRSFLASKSKMLEHDILKAHVIRDIRLPMDEKILLLKEFVPTIDNWSVNDTLAGKWNMKDDEKEIMWDHCVSLLDSGKEFMMRFAVVMMMNNFSDDRTNDILAHIIPLDHPGYYYRMGSAWCLSMCYAKHPGSVEDVLFDGRLEKEILRMTVGKIRDSYRVSAEDKERVMRRFRQGPRSF